MFFDRIFHIYLFFRFFFLMIRRPPRSTLFPTRRSSDLIEHDLPMKFVIVGAVAVAAMIWVLLTFRPIPGAQTRSEEHTSELQSHSDLVCRLLLEKKKKKQTHTYHKM